MQESSLGFLKKLDIDRIEVGMYLEDVFNSKGVLLITANAAITSPEQIEYLKKQGVRTAYINISKGKDVPAIVSDDLSNVESENDDRELAYHKELERAKEVHKATVIAAKQMLNDARMGKSISTETVQKAAEGIVDSILRNPDALVSLTQIKGYDEYTYTHSVNVGILITSLAQSMGYRAESLLEAGMGGLLHDIGKMRVPDYILNKPGKYTDAEFAVMKRHPEYGLEILRDKANISDTSKLIVGLHHERYNGSGYPRNLKGNQIHELGLIAAVADVYDAMTTDRVYRAAWTPQKALALIFQGCDQDYSRKIVELFAKHLGIYPVGSFVRLHSGEMGVVVRIEKGALLAPDVLILFDKNGKKLITPLEYALFRKQKEVDGQHYKIEVSLNPKAYNVDISKYIQGKHQD